MAAMAAMAETNEIIRLDEEVLVKIKELGRAWARKAIADAPANPWIETVAAAHFSFPDRWDTWRWVRL